MRFSLSVMDVTEFWEYRTTAICEIVKVLTVSVRVFVF